MSVFRKGAVFGFCDVFGICRMTSTISTSFSHHFASTSPRSLCVELVEELDNLQDALTTFRKETDDGEELELHGFEVAALMNLVIADTTVEEACSLIPSLTRLPEAAIDEILDLIKNTMMRIVS